MSRLLLHLIFLGAPTTLVATPVDFIRDVRPIFKQHCYACHGAKKSKGGLRLDRKDFALKGGLHHGPDILPGNPQQSPLIHFLTHPDPEERMPRKSEPLSPMDIDTIVRWIDQGAPWPEGADESAKDHWSFKPVQRSEPPEVTNRDWPRNEVDRFVLARLEQADLKPAPAAQRTTWLRRVAFDLTGLPPTPEQLAAFLKDTSSKAFERVVDELLASPRYGERWAQHWLDVVRYADTHGFEVNTERPHAWPYRDYVIRAFNRDIPYNRFIREQIAGDAYGEDAATGFLVTASVLLPGQIGKDEPSKRLARQDSLDEVVANIGQSFLGLSMSCARCHDHMFDPISQRDYYGMQAFVAGVHYGNRPLRTETSVASRRDVKELKNRWARIERGLAGFHPLAGGDSTVREPVQATRNTDRFTPVTSKRLRFTILETMVDNRREPCIDELEVFNTAGDNVALARAGTRTTASGSRTESNRHELRFLNDGNYGNSRSWMSNERGRGWVMLEFPKEEMIDRVVWGRDREGTFSDRLAVAYRIETGDAEGNWVTVADATDRKPFDPDQKPHPGFSLAGLDPEEARRAENLLQEQKKLRKKLEEPSKKPLAFAGIFRQPDRIHLLRRGDPEQPEEEIAPATLSILNPEKLPHDATEQARRKVLADWIARPDNPLTARVLVNRIWQGHFGTGLVETANDFGQNGTRPSHPELLDWLADEFVRSGWSIKALHRRIVLSATYRQSSRIDPTAVKKDTANRLLWRFPSRRLEGEAIRDAMLAVSGR
ncbi:MAG: DUF1549 domain-containing protein, partial [Verrucomicrobiota bacterium]